MHLVIYVHFSGFLNLYPWGVGESVVLWRLLGAHGVSGSLPERAVGDWGFAGLLLIEHLGVTIPPFPPLISFSTCWKICCFPSQLNCHLRFTSLHGWFLVLTTVLSHVWQGFVCLGL
jgi:hypothetical protein